VMFFSDVVIRKSPNVATKEPSAVTSTPSLVGRNKKGNKTGR
jgi:hypothetical protein